MSGVYDVVIVGGGHGGAQAASMLRQYGFSGRVAIISEEPELPYDRPPLSKDYLSGDMPWEKVRVRSRDAWAERRIELLLGRTVARIDADKHEVTTSGDETFSYSNLIWAAGGSPRRLACAGADLDGIHSVRTRADVDRLVAELPDVRDVVIIGGGYIGLEAAAVLSKLGKQVAVLESCDRVLARVAGPPLSHFYENEHRARGVDVKVGVQVERIEGADGRAAAVRIADGSVVSAQMLVVGIGIDPSVAAVLDAGAEGGNGVRVDDYCRTSLPDVYAVGDCAEHRNLYAGGEWIRLESVQNANDQAAVAAKAICGKPEPYHAVPWFWSNQFDLKLQTVGISRGYDACVVRGDPRSRSFSVVYLRDGMVVALDCVNSVRDYSHGRGLVAAHARADPAKLADTSLPLKTLVAADA